MIKNIENDDTYKPEINATLVFIQSLAAGQEKYEHFKNISKWKEKISLKVHAHMDYVDVLECRS